MRRMATTTLKAHWDPDPPYRIVGADGTTQIFISQVLFTFTYGSYQVEWTVDYLYYNKTWGQDRGANLMIDLKNSSGGTIPGNQIYTVVEHNHCTFGGAQVGLGRGSTSGYDLARDGPVVAIALRSDRLDYDVGVCADDVVSVPARYRE